MNVTEKWKLTLERDEKNVGKRAMLISKSRSTWDCLVNGFKVNHPSLNHGHNPLDAHWNFKAIANV